MCDRNRTPLTVVVAGLALFVTGLSLGQDAKEIWGKRIWERKVDDHRKIVVDERGTPSKDPPFGIVMPDYDWRLLENGKQDGPILFTRLGWNPASSAGPPSNLEPVEVLYTDLINGDLVTVFNQHEAFNKRDRCWALLVHTDPDGSRVRRPASGGRSTAAHFADNGIGPAMKTAQMEKKPDGTLLLTVTDKEDKTHKFQMRLQKDNADEEHWEPVEEK